MAFVVGWDVMWRAGPLKEFLGQTGPVACVCCASVESGPELDGTPTGPEPPLAVVKWLHSIIGGRDLTPAEEIGIVEELKRDPSPSNPCFERLVEAYKRRLRGFIRMRAHADSDVDEILDETWMKFWRSIPRLHLTQSGPERSPVSAFLYRVAVNAMIDYYRRTERHAGKVVVLMEDLRTQGGRLRGSESSSDSQSQPIEFSGTDPSPEEVYADWELKELVLKTAFGKTGRPPHELLVFGFTVCLGHKPQDLVRSEISGRPLRFLEGDLEEGMVGGSSIPASKLAELFGPLRDSMDWSVSRIEDHLRVRTAPTVGASVLSDYSSRPDSPAEDIRIWRYNVLRRTIVLATKWSSRRTTRQR